MENSKKEIVTMLIKFYNMQAGTGFKSVVEKNQTDSV